MMKVKSFDLAKNETLKMTMNEQIPETDCLKTKRCKHCDAIVPAGDLFCPECGLCMGQDA